jgi:cytochrome c peroxidase
MQKTVKFSRIGFGTAFVLLALLCSQCNKTPDSEIPEEFNVSALFSNKDLQLFGEKLFFDEALSDPEGQSCAACHGPEVGWTGPDESINKTGGVYQGALHQRFGNRKPNSSAYATLSPLFHAVIEDDQVLFVGGNFWDGRATGYILGNPAADQAQFPFLNPLEQNIASAAILVGKVISSDYLDLFNRVGEDIWDIEKISESENVDLQFGIIGLAIAAFENSDKVNQFSSKYDYYLRGDVSLTDVEMLGLELFDGKGECNLCHISELGPDGSFPLFTDFTYDNLGMPTNPQNPEGLEWIDPGLEDFLRTMPHYAMYASESRGKHRVPTLRNIDKRPHEGFVKAHGHNGYSALS